MNLNFNTKNEYSLHSRLINEAINLYGVPVRFLVTDKIVDSLSDNTHFSEDSDYFIFGDFKTLKTDLYRDSIQFNVLVQENEEYPNGLQFAFNNFGLINDDTLTVLVSIKSLSSLNSDGNVHLKEIISNLLLFPNGKLMEITDCQIHVPGGNNKFLYTNQPSCYQLSLKSYAFDRSAVDLVHKNDSRIQTDPTDNFGPKTIQNIDAFFQKQDDLSSSINKEANKETFVPDENLNLKTVKPKVDDVFGSFS